MKAADFGVRVVTLRFGVVLGAGGGALKRMMLPFKFFAGGWVGSGRQWFPWVHSDDVMNVLLFALKTESLSGAVNVAAPQPVTMNEFCKTLGRVMHRPCWAPVPGFVLKLFIGGMAGMLLDGQRIVPKKLLKAGYRFHYSSLEEALRQILQSKR